jgi:hypothetical protein
MSRFRPAGFRNGRTAWRRASRPDSGRPARRRSTAFRDGWTAWRRRASRNPLRLGTRSRDWEAGAPRSVLHGGRPRQIRGSVPSQGARVLEVRSRPPPAASLRTIGPSPEEDALDMALAETAGRNDDLDADGEAPFSHRDRILGQVSADDGGPNRIGVNCGCRMRVCGPNWRQRPIRTGSAISPSLC